MAEQNTIERRLRYGLGCMGLVFVWVGVFLGFALFAGGNYGVPLLALLVLFVPLTVIWCRFGSALIWRSYPVLHHDDRDISLRTRNVRRGRIVLWAGVGLIVVMIVASSRILQPPSDQALIDALNRHEAALRRVVAIPTPELSTLAGSDVPDSSGTVPNANPTDAHKRDYAIVKKALNRDHFVQIDDESNATAFMFWTEGSFFGTTSVKGIAYLPKPPAETVPSLDNAPIKAEIYRHVRANWYLYRKYFPH